MTYTYSKYDFDDTPFRYSEFLEKPNVKRFYNAMLRMIKEHLNSNTRINPITVRFEYWIYRIDKNNKVTVTCWIDNKRRRINRELKILYK